MREVSECGKIQRFLHYYYFIRFFEISAQILIRESELDFSLYKSRRETKNKAIRCIIAKKRILFQIFKMQSVDFQEKVFLILGRQNTDPRWNINTIISEFGKN